MYDEILKRLDRIDAGQRLLDSNDFILFMGMAALLAHAEPDSFAGQMCIAAVLATPPVWCVSMLVRMFWKRVKVSEVKGS